MKRPQMTKLQWVLYGSLVLVTAGVLVAAFALGRNSAEPATVAQYGHNLDETEALPTDSQQRIDDAVVTATEANATQTVDDRLLYLIEEEKLAHDVYTKMYDLYGARTFSNIARSETMHQNLVLNVLESRSLTDPRSDVDGVFVNQDLQQLYNTLVAQGSQNLTEAYKVGVTIEEVDIADLTASLKLVDPADTDVISMMETLKHGSENHLRAFSRHI